MLKSTYIVPSTKATTGTSTKDAWPEATAAPRLPSAHTRTMSDPIISRRRFHRSTATPKGSAKSAHGTSRAKPVRPAFAGECVSDRTSSV